MGEKAGKANERTFLIEIAFFKLHTIPITAKMTSDSLCSVVDLDIVPLAGIVEER